MLLSKTKAFCADEVGTIVPYALEVMNLGSNVLSTASTSDLNELYNVASDMTTVTSAPPSVASETLRVLGAAILDQHSVWWAIASPLFALSVAPYLLFLQRIYSAPSATDEMRASFATLLLFVVVSIPAEAYTQEQYGTVLSNIDALHFLIQAAISLTNLRVMLAFRDAVGFVGPSTVETENNQSLPTNSIDSSFDSWEGEGWDGRFNSQRGGPLVSVDWGGGGDGGNVSKKTSNFQRSAEKLRPGQLVEAAAGVALVSTFGLMALDSRLVQLEDLGIASTSLELFVNNFRQMAASTADLLAPGLPPGPANALSVPTWGVHVFSLVEWLVAMGLVWQYAETSKNKGWRRLTWGMLPLHASGVCACAQHFFFNANDLEWLVTAQGALTFAGNSGMCYAAGEIIEEDGKMREVQETGAVGAMGTVPSASSDTHDDTRGDSRINLSAYIADFDVENFASLWRRDGDAFFASKIALLSLTVAAVVRAASLVSGPFTGDGGELQFARGWIAGAFVMVPFLLNVQKWKRRESEAEDFIFNLESVAVGVSSSTETIRDAVDVAGGFNLTGSIDSNGANDGGSKAVEKRKDEEVKASR